MSTRSLPQTGATGASASSSATATINTLESEMEMLKTLGNQLKHQMDVTEEAADATLKSGLADAAATIATSIAEIVGGAVGVAAALGSFGASIKSFKMTDDKVVGINAQQNAPVVDEGGEPRIEQVVKPRPPAPAAPPAPDAAGGAGGGAAAGPDPAGGGGAAAAGGAGAGGAGGGAAAGGADPAAGAGDREVKAAPENHGPEGTAPDEPRAKTRAEQEKAHEKKWGGGATALAAVGNSMPSLGNGVGGTVAYGSKTEKAEADQAAGLWSGAGKVFDQLVSLQQALVSSTLERVGTILQANASASVQGR